ncbi:hypothetical protein BRE01_29440 [Brevibacillus reuszeri]|uniref:Uncharacterized protein n=2 Tax=Brevibacillus reuszeri TaxID=54915 RepID=A0A0K9YJ46_9BACL|nr:hypothetical protein ADS79_32715 [Brevibacillus reuszeri]GED69242.1 hypothetical protein BRE01_29440 [Brevibacillus reuszeri]
MSVTPFIIAVFVLVFVAFVLTFRIGLNPEEATQRSFGHRSRNLLYIYGIVTLILLIALSVYLYNL